MTTRGKAIIWIVSSFLVGVVAGAALFYGLDEFGRESDRKWPTPAVLAEKMNEDANLQLDDEQMADLVAILENSQDRYRELRSEWREKSSMQRQETREEIRGILSQEQLERFNQFIEERHRHKERSKPKDNRKDR